MSTDASETFCKEAVRYVLEKIFRDLKEAKVIDMLRISVMHLATARTYEEKSMTAISNLMTALMNILTACACLFCFCACCREPLPEETDTGAAAVEDEATCVYGIYNSSPPRLFNGSDL